MSKSPPRPKPSARAVQREQTRSRRAGLAQQDQDLFEIIAYGFSYEEIAKQGNVSVATVRRRLARAIARRKLDDPHTYMHLQVERLNKALTLVNMTIDRKDISAIEPLMKLVDRLDRYHGLAGLWRRASLAAPTEPAAALAAPSNSRALRLATPPLAIAAPDSSD